VFSLLRENISGDDTVDIAIEDDDFKELALHFELLSVVGVVTTLVLAPVVVNIISDYINRRLNRDIDEGKVRFQLTVAAKGKGHEQFAQVTYDGPAKEFQASMTAALEQIPRCDVSTKMPELLNPDNCNDA